MMGRTLAIPIYKALLCFVINAQLSERVGEREGEREVGVERSMGTKREGEGGGGRGESERQG